MRHRIRVIGLLLVVALLFVILWSIRIAWVPSAEPGQHSPEPSSSASDDLLPVETSAEPSPPYSEVSAFPSESPTQEPLYDTSGL